jgi:sulfite oxidase
MISRRDVLTYLATAAAASRLAPFEFLAQERPRQLYGKDKLIIRSLRPPDFETPVSLLNTFITPNDAFYVRSHLPIPQVDAAAWALKVGGEVSSPLSLSVDEIRKLPAATVTVTLECAGNGRAFFEPALAGIQWEKGAVSTARFTGARMSDVLKKAGVNTAGRNVEMHAADRPLGTMPAFVRQVPMAKALHPDTLIAYEMNGEPIPLVHGAPLRAIIPGWEGAYSIKWLNALNVIAADSSSFWVATGYRYPTRRVAPGAAVDAKEMAPLTGLVVKSLITTPEEGTPFTAGTSIPVSGFAWAGELDITRVDLSLDHGATWQPARLTGEQAKYAWRRFELDVKVPQAGSYLILSRATDSKGNVQPAVSQWNPSGYLWNQYDSVRVDVDVPRAAVSHAPAGSPPQASIDAGAATYKRACLACHDEDIIAQQKLTPTGWTRSVEKMMRWGANVTDADKPSLVDYLASRFGPR